MRRCKRCGWKKPDSLFIDQSYNSSKEEVTPEHARVRERCLHCRTIFTLIGHVTKPPPPPFLPSSPVPDPLVRKEFAAFKARGCPRIARTYTRRPDNVMYDNRLW